MRTYKFVGVYHVSILHWKDYIKQAINTAEILLLTQNVTVYMYKVAYSLMMYMKV